MSESQEKENFRFYYKNLQWTKNEKNISVCVGGREREVDIYAIVMSILENS